MAITTVFSPEDYANTSLAIVKEFIQTYLDGIDITFLRPQFDENKTPNENLPRYKLWLEYRGDDFREVGMGQSLSNGRKGQKGYISFWIWHYTADHLGKEKKTLEVAAELKSIFNQHKGDLGAAGLRNVKIGNLRPIYKEPGMTIYGGRQLCTFEVLLEW